MDFKFTDSKKINGLLLASEIEGRVRQRIAKLKFQSGLTPQIVSYFDPEHAPSALYTSKKFEAAESVGILFSAREYSLSESLDNLEGQILDDNQDSELDGIMLQLPAPRDLGEAAEKITPQKDVDGLTKEGRKIYIPATVRGTLTLIDYTLGPNWINKQIVVLGATGMVGASLIDVLKQKNAKSIIGLGRKILQENPEKYFEALKNADILISATGHESEIDPNLVKEGFIFINVGLDKPQEGLLKKASKYSPQFGGTGPMTVWALMENVADAFEKRVNVLKS